MNRLVAVLFALAVVTVPAAQTPRLDPVGTFSILGFDPATGEVGGAVQSRVFSVGNGVLWAEAGLGAVATQAIVDVSYGPKGLALLRAGMAPEAIIKAIWESDSDPRPDNWTKQGRQFAVIDAKGNTAVFTGPKATAWAGHRQGKFCTAQGNILKGEPVVDNMVKAFEETQGHLSMRLMAALDAGQAAGGDTRGMQSAAMLIVGKGLGVWLNNDTVLRLQVDDSPEPMKEMRRLVEGWNDRRAKRQQRPVGHQRSSDSNRQERCCAPASLVSMLSFWPRSARPDISSGRPQKLDSFATTLAFGDV